MPDNNNIKLMLQHPGRFLDDPQRQWLKPPGWRAALLHRLLFSAAGGCVRCLFRFHVEGREHLPTQAPVIFAPNHESSLDAPLLAAALPGGILQRTFWVVRKGRVLANPLTRIAGRLAQAVPVERAASALAAGAGVLARKYNLVWFPEGTRSRDGRLQEFKFGVGALAHHLEVAVIPVAIEGAYEAWPPGERFPRLFSKVSVRFGKPLLPDEMLAEPDAESYQQVADEVRERVEELTEPA